MTAAPRDLARPVLQIYWLTLVGGLALFATTRSDDAATTAALLIGALGGTLLGHALALRNLRFWLAALIIAAVAIYAGPLIPDGVAATRLWLAFIPAALCAFWSLGDRSGLVAAWFPAVIWMLTILDRAGLAVAPDGTAAILLAGLAALFVWFLHARESRRVNLWRSVAAEPLAAARSIELLRQPPGRHLARAAWAVSVGAITTAIMVWLVPPLWQREALGGPTVQITEPTFVGLRCCPARRDADTESARIKEYLGLGLGHDEHATRLREGSDCRVCAGPPSQSQRALVAGRPPGEPINGWVGHGPGRGGIAIGGTVAVDSRVAAAAPGPTSADSYSPAPAGSIALPNAASPNAASPNTASPSATSPNATSPNAASPSAASPNAASPNAALPTPTPASASPNAASPNAASPNAASPSAASPNAASPSAASPNAAFPTPTPTAAPPTPTPTAAPPTPTPAPIATGGAPPAAEPTDPARVAATESPTAPQRGLAGATGPSLLGWLALAVFAAALLQLVRLALRPLRRLATLRHLRRPFWDETVDQRVSNAWQLALIGLRDAGWRAGTSEAPRELARRVGIDGIDRCAAILERARHGVGLAAGDLAEMQTSADAAYRASRRDLGGVARALGWLRWPLT